jgi:hypothetical protein
MRLPPQLKAKSANKVRQSRVRTRSEWPRHRLIGAIFDVRCHPAWLLLNVHSFTASQNRWASEYRALSEACGSLWNASANVVREQSGNRFQIDEGD